MLFEYFLFLYVCIYFIPQLSQFNCCWYETLGRVASWLFRTNNNYTQPNHFDNDLIEEAPISSDEDNEPPPLPPPRTDSLKPTVNGVADRPLPTIPQSVSDDDLTYKGDGDSLDKTVSWGWDKCEREPISNREFAEQRRPLPSLPPEDEEEEEEREAEGSSEDSLEEEEDEEDNNEKQISRTESPVSERDDNEAKSR